MVTIAKGKHVLAMMRQSDKLYSLDNKDMKDYSRGVTTSSPDPHLKSPLLPSSITRMT